MDSTLRHSSAQASSPQVKNITSLLCALLLLTSCTQKPLSDSEKEFNESGRAKAIEHEEDMWQYYMDEETGLS
ncbi:hypothetical protein KKC44_00835 [Patescibacteria group bacterium]|nr:hypothetical protein [Patescibacteria group bacterium]MBU2259129.1 hypothetical protein [Patescibacteria group bacterium]